MTVLYTFLLMFTDILRLICNDLQLGDLTVGEDVCHGYILGQFLYTFLLMPLTTLANAISMIFVDNTVANLSGGLFYFPLFFLFPELIYPPETADTRSVR